MSINPLRMALVAATLGTLAATRPTDFIPCDEASNSDDDWYIPLPRKRSVAKMDAPHDYPPSPFESRQVRRARKRREAKLNNS